MNNKFYFLTFLLIFLSCSVLYSQMRVAVLPFQNINGVMDLNIYCYKFQDTLAKSFIELEKNDSKFHIVPQDSVETVLADLNVDPTGPQYMSDMWKAVKLLNVQKVITGNFNFTANRFLINCFVYTVSTKLADPNNQAVDLFKKQETIFESVPVIIRNIKPAITGQ